MLTRIHLMTTTSHPTMNLINNLYEEADALASDEFKEYARKIYKQQTLQILRGRPFPPMFAPHHHIQPRKDVAHDDAPQV